MNAESQCLRFFRVPQRAAEVADLKKGESHIVVKHGVRGVGGRGGFVVTQSLFPLLHGQE